MVARQGFRLVGGHGSSGAGAFHPIWVARPSICLRDQQGVTMFEQGQLPDLKSGISRVRQDGRHKSGEPQKRNEGNSLSCINMTPTKHCRSRLSHKTVQWFEVS